ncbi:MAG: hypothetical protein EXR51_07835 [Dehalococcoidia bacterium]|nr:hypothetical protein [Dehalococcoidia bacterium]
MPAFASEYQEMLESGGACRGADGYTAHALPGDEPRFAPDRTALVRHIRLEIDLDIPNKSISGMCTTTLEAVAPGLESIIFDAVELRVGGVTLEGAGALDYESEGDQLRVKLPAPANPGERFTIRIAYRATPRRGLYFIGPDEAYPDKPLQVWSQGQDEDSRHWFPCLDYPHQKATSEVIATVPQELFALSNGALVETTQDHGRGTKSYHWRLDVPHSCYLITLAVGDFAEIEERAGGVPVVSYVQRRRKEEARRTLGRTPDMVAFFSENLGVPYPYDRYAQVFVADFIFGGMENTTATTLTDTVLYDERAALDYNVDSLVAHELAHQWFGDLLTCADWSHGWLNEGFATYFDALYREHHLGDDEFRYWLQGVAETYFSEDPGHYRRPIVSNVYHEPIDLFDRHLYEKGALVLHLLRSELGDALFWKALGHYVTKHRTQSVVTLDLQRAVEEATGRNLERFFQQWVHRPGYPEFKVSYAWDEAAKSAKLTVAQTQGEGLDTPVFAVPLEIEFGGASGPVTRRVEISEKTHTFYLPLPEKPLSVRVDPRGWVLKKLDFDRPKELLLHQLRHSAGALGRVDAVQALGRLGTPEAVRALSETLQHDSFWGVQREAAKALGSIRSQAALEALLESKALAHPKARRAVVQALGEFRDAAAAEALAAIARNGDASWFVEAEAGRALGKTRSPLALETLTTTVQRESFNQVVRVAALDGLAELGDEQGIAIAQAWAPYGKPQTARASAIAALGKLGKLASEKSKDAVRDALLRYLDDPWLRVRMGAIGALEELKDTTTVPALERLGRADLDGRVQRRAREAVIAIRRGSDKSDDVKKLRDDLDRALRENRELRDRLDQIEARVNGAGPASS